jgi:hypothetical protein
MRDCNPHWETLSIASTTIPIFILLTPNSRSIKVKGLSDYIKGSHLITLKGEGQTGYGWGSACVDDAMDSFLVL